MVINTAYPTHLYSWDGETMTLWPNDPKEVKVILPDFETAFRLGMSIKKSLDESFKAGRQSLHDQVTQIIP